MKDEKSTESRRPTEEEAAAGLGALFGPDPQPSLPERRAALNRLTKSDIIQAYVKLEDSFKEVENLTNSQSDLIRDLMKRLEAESAARLKEQLVHREV
jgi:hypothetical protein